MPCTCWAWPRLKQAGRSRGSPGSPNRWPRIPISRSQSRTKETLIWRSTGLPRRWRAYERSLELAPDYPLALFGCGNALAALRRPAEALSNFDRALRGAPKLAQAHLGRGRALLGLGQHAEALLSIDRALELRPNHAEAYLERAHVMSELEDLSAAIGAYDRALECNPALAAAWFDRGLALSLLGRHAEAAESLRRVLEIDPAYPYARGARLHAELQIADWTDYPASAPDILARLERDERVDFPFSFLAVCDSTPCSSSAPAVRRTAAGRRALSTGATRSTDRGSSRERIRIAYISADFLSTRPPTSWRVCSSGMIAGASRPSAFRCARMQSHRPPARPGGLRAMDRASRLRMEISRE